MKVFLNVPFSDNAAVKKLGARWSPGNKRWYVENAESITPFLKWVPAHLKKPAKDVSK